MNMAKKKLVKTNAVRILDQANISYQILEYNLGKKPVDGVSVASEIGHPAEHVFKTLVTTGGTNKFYVFVIPVNTELDLKACAKVVGEKKIEMLPMKDLLAVTGYVRGGCSPVGMKKLFPTFIDQSAETLEYMIVSAGKIGMQILLNPKDLQNITKAKFASLSKGTS